jgi:hypothetical protein
MFGSPPTPQAAPPPPNPPMYGASVAGGKKPSGSSNPMSTIIGSQLNSAGASTGQKTLLGQ